VEAFLKLVPTLVLDQEHIKSLDFLSGINDRVPQPNPAVSDFLARNQEAYYGRPLASNEDLRKVFVTSSVFNSIGIVPKNRGKLNVTIGFKILNRYNCLIFPRILKVVTDLNPEDLTPEFEQLIGAPSLPSQGDGDHDRRSAST